MMRTTALPRLSFLIGLLSLSAVSLAAPAGKWDTVTFAGTGEKGFSGDGGPATAARLSDPSGLTRGPDEAIYVCDTANHAIRRIAPDGKISTVAGTGKAGYSGDGGPATKAELNEPYEVRFDKAGDLFIVERLSHTVRKVDAKTQAISTIAGTGHAGFSGDGGPATKAAFNQPHSIQFDARGELYVCDIGNNRIRRIDTATGVVNTFAGTGERKPTPDRSPIRGTPLNGPRAIDFDKEGNLWVALRDGNAIYRLDVKAGVIHHVAGTGQKGFGGNGGPAAKATLSGPKGISVAPDGNVYFADTESHSIRMIDVSKGTVELFAGTGEKGDGPDGEALKCHMSRPHGIFADADGSVFVGDTEAYRVRHIRKAP